MNERLYGVYESLQTHNLYPIDKKTGLKETESRFKKRLNKQKNTNIEMIDRYYDQIEENEKRQKRLKYSYLKKNQIQTNPVKKQIVQKRK